MRAGGRKGGEDFARCLAFSGGACGEEIGEPCIYCIFYQVCFDFKRQMRITFVSTFGTRVRNLGADLGGKFGIHVYTVFFTKSVLISRDKCW